MRSRVAVAALVLAPVLVVGVLVAAAVTGAFGGGTRPRATPAPRPTERGFDGARAWKLLTYQVALGPRPSGSAPNRRLAAFIRARLPRGRYEDEAGGVRNVVGQIPGRGKPVVVAAHYDSKVEPFRFVGANDGAGGTAALLELARALQRVRRPAGAPPIRFVAFDGEEAPSDDADFYSTGLRGSRPYARAHARQLRALVLLDFVADKDLEIPREAGSDAQLWSRLRAAARRAGVGSVFPAQTRGEILDDHTPFARAGVPSIDLIDFDFPCWHKACDDLTAVSQRSLTASGAAVFELLRSWR